MTSWKPSAEQAFAQRRRRDRARHGGRRGRAARRRRSGRRASPVSSTAASAGKAPGISPSGSSLARQQAGVEPRVDQQPRPVQLEDERAVHDARDAEVGVRRVEGRLARQRDRRAGAPAAAAQRRGEDGERAEPRHTAPSWRRPSKSTMATAVARFRLRTWGLASGMRVESRRRAPSRIASGSPRLSPPKTSRSSGAVARPRCTTRGARPRSRAGARAGAPRRNASQLGVQRWRSTCGQ